MTQAPHELVVEPGPPVVASLSGEIDSLNAREIEHALRTAAPGAVLVVDLTGVDFLDSAGLAMLDSVRQGTDLRVVVVPSSIVGRVLDIAGMTRIIPCFPSVEAARRP